VHVAVPLERLDSALEGGLHLPRGNVDHVHSLGQDLALS
jgi:hypothetical protein